MVIAFAILGLIVGAGMGEFWGAAIGCAAGAWLGHWLKKTKPPTENAFAATVGSEPPARDAATSLADAETLDERGRLLPRRVAHLESEVVRMGGSSVAGASAATAASVESGVAGAPTVD